VPAKAALAVTKAALAYEPAICPPATNAVLAAS